jgi:uncharacterized protein (TIGR03067 family)
MSAATGAALLDGTWVPVAAEVSGSSLDVRQLRVARLIIALPEYRIVDQDDATLDAGTAQLGESVSPRTLDLQVVAGPYAGRHLSAIVALQDDRLCVCYDLECDARPHSWQAEAGQLLLSITYVRAVGTPLAS